MNMLSELNKCLTLVHLTPVFRLDFRYTQSRGQGLLVFPDLVTALMGCLLSIGSPPVATGAIAGADQHWRS